MAKNRVDDEMPDDAVPVPDPWAVLNRMAAALEGLQTRLTESPSTRNDETVIQLTEALKAVSAAQLTGAQLIASETRRAHRPSNEVTPGISVFNRRGELTDKSLPGPHKLPLKCPMLIPDLVDWYSCTREEVELLNLVSEKGEYLVKLVDGSKIKMTVNIEFGLDDKPSRMLINHETAFNKENFRNVPAVTDRLRQILKQHKDAEIRAAAAAVMTDEEEEALIAAGQLFVQV